MVQIPGMGTCVFFCAPAANMLCNICRREGEDDEEGMDDWDQDKLEEVVKQKHGTEKNRPTDIICKFFLDAVEKKMYGW